MSACSGTTGWRPLFAPREANVADDADEASAGNEHAEGVPPDFLQFARKCSYSSMWPSWPGFSLYRLRVQ